MRPRALARFLVLVGLSLAVAILGTRELGPIALVVAGAGAATAVFDAIQHGGLRDR